MTRKRKASRAQKGNQNWRGRGKKRSITYENVSEEKNQEVRF